MAFYRNDGFFSINKFDEHFKFLSYDYNVK